MLNRFFKVSLLFSLSLAMISFPIIAQANTLSDKIAYTGNIQRDTVIVRIATGATERKLSKTNEWVPVAIGMPLNKEDIIRTGKNSFILLELPENSGYVRLLPESEMRVDKISVTKGSQGGQITEFYLSKGKIVTKVRKFNRPTSKLEIHTKSSTAAVRGTSFLTSFNDDNETRVLVGDGRVSVKAQNKEVFVNPKEFTNVALDGEPITPSLVDSKIDFKISSMKANNSFLNVSGSVDTDAQINLNHVSVFPNEDGSFVGDLRLKEGENDVTIKASTIDGREKEKLIKVLKFTK